eukprot:GCRY01002511.1.p1 GENE.GCRY01002511.1~~GCRY01002511.1.p1  ORF type:complete len:218 (+),score=29.78 GCRY01002511.1:122-775(+)
MSLPTIIVTGASRGLGRSVAKSLVEKFGARVVLNARSFELLGSFCEELNQVKKNSAVFVAGDINSPECRHEITRCSLSEFGAIDGLINNAATTGAFKRIETLEKTDLVDAFEKNLFTPLLFTQEILEHLRQSKLGTVVNVSSMLANQPLSGLGSYCLSKAALNMLSKCINAEEESIMRPFSRFNCTVKVAFASLCAETHILEFIFLVGNAFRRFFFP